MGRRFPEGLDAALERVNEYSDRVLYPYLRVHVFGPYVGDCHAYLTEIKLSLHERKFTGVKLCSDRDEDPPERKDGQTELDYEQAKREFWWEVSKDFMANADASVFVFLDDEPQRPSLPDRAFEKKRSDRTRTPSDPNASVIQELNEWLGTFDVERERTLVVFEERCYEEMGGMVSGNLGTEDVDWIIVDSLDVEDAVEAITSACQEWAFHTFRMRLRDRFVEDRREEDDEEGIWLE